MLPSARFSMRELVLSGHARLNVVSRGDYREPGAGSCAAGTSAVCSLAVGLRPGRCLSRRL
jgi:hypothetical protein